MEGDGRDDKTISISRQELVEAAHRLTDDNLYFWRGDALDRLLIPIDDGDL
jgi:hypothetical protein